MYIDIDLGPMSSVRSVIPERQPNEGSLRKSKPAAPTTKVATRCLSQRLSTIIYQDGCHSILRNQEGYETMSKESVTESKTIRMETSVYNATAGTVAFILYLGPYTRWTLPYGNNRTWIYRLN
jgi:hypothetical protein